MSRGREHRPMLRRNWESIPMGTAMVRMSQFWLLRLSDYAVLLSAFVYSGMYHYCAMLSASSARGSHHTDALICGKTVNAIESRTAATCLSDRRQLHKQMQ